jgi:hypothetical protein
MKREIRVCLFEIKKKIMRIEPKKKRSRAERAGLYPMQNDVAIN